MHAVSQASRLSSLSSLGRELGSRAISTTHRSSGPLSDERWKVHRSLDRASINLWSVAKE